MGYAMRALACLLVAAPLAQCFYLPGVAPTDYDDGGEVDLMVTQLNSRRTQLPYDFYTLPVCRPERIDNQHLSLGEVLMGDHHILNSPYALRMNKTEFCRQVCEVSLGEEEISHLKQLIDDEYVVNMLVDSLPAAMPNGATDGYVTGFVLRGISCSVQ